MDVKILREHQGITQSELAEATGIPRDRIAKWEQKKGSPKTEDAETLKKYFETKREEVPRGTETSPPPVADYLVTRRNKKNASNLFMAPLIPVKAQAGYVKASDQAVFMDTLEKYALPPGVDPHGAIWGYWEVEGDSMEPTFHNGDFILATQVPREDWDQLRNFYTYIIITTDRVLIKRIYAKNDLEWVLISDNEDHHPQQLLSVEYIRQVWVFRRRIDSKAPAPKVFEIKV